MLSWFIKKEYFSQKSNTHNKQVLGADLFNKFVLVIVIALMF